MLEVTSKQLRDAKAGNYVPTTLGYLKHTYLKSTPAFPPSLLTEDDVVLLDISFYQRVANFLVMKENGVKGVIIRAGQNLWVDTCARTFMRDATAANMPFGSYFLFDSRVSPEEQAKTWKEALIGFTPKLWCWADYEENYGGQYGGWNNFYNFLEKCKIEMPGIRLGVYTGYFYWLEHSPTNSASLNYFLQYPLWEAWYSSNPAYVRVPQPWTNLLIWQRTDKGDGTKYGVGSLNVDMNRFNGTLSEFYAYFGIDGNNGGQMAELTYKGTVRTGATVIVRATPAGTDTGQRLASGSVVYFVGQKVLATLNGITYDWLNLSTGGWVATLNLTVEALPPTTPPTATEITVDVVARDVYTAGDVYAARGVKLTKEV